MRATHPMRRPAFERATLSNGLRVLLARRTAVPLVRIGLVVSGWTLTLAARALREAGASEVLPLTLAVQT
jgi:hypothetical protein